VSVVTQYVVLNLCQWLRHHSWGAPTDRLLTVGSVPLPMSDEAGSC
jgi:hypothetical protein